MLAQSLLQKRIAVAHPDIHRTRLNSVMMAVDALLHCETLQLSAIGCAMHSDTTDKHSIKRIDRLLGNVHLAGDSLSFYDWMSSQLLGNKMHPVILIDYSDVNAERTHFILRAAVPVGGRALSLYEEVHDKENHRALLTKFLETLALLLPEDCQPILVTDAGQSHLNPVDGRSRL
jgi:hypothetical protein